MIESPGSLQNTFRSIFPGIREVVVQNIPGGGSMIAANQLFNLTKPDGLTIGIFNRGMPFAQLLKAEGVKFDLRKFNWLGSVSVEISYARPSNRPSLQNGRGCLEIQEYDHGRKRRRAQ